MKASIHESELYRNIPIAGSEVPLPASGMFYTFLDSENDNLLSRKDSAGDITVVQLTQAQVDAVNSIGDILTILNSI